MHRFVTRRDFLKLLTLIPPSVYFSKYAQNSSVSQQENREQNIVILVFDALTATNISLHGYQRDTMSNLARIADRATVYHNHYAAGNFTTPGVASLLTGTYPWTHRAVNLGGAIVEEKRKQNLFNLFAHYYRIAYSHNNFVNAHLASINSDLDHLKPQMDLFVKRAFALDRLFPWENDIANLAWERSATSGEKGYTHSLFLSHLYKITNEKKEKELLELFPKGITRIGDTSYFLLEDAIDWLQSQLGGLPQPFLGYFHFLPPHRPYSPKREYVDVFKDDGVGYHFDKPGHLFFRQSSTENSINLRYQSRQRQIYDEFLLYADSELGRLLDFMEQTKMIENTWFIFTSDHGEMFERGIFGHRTPTLYEPIVRIPLLISGPGQTQRQDVQTLTSAVDVLPTLLHITGQEVPAWVEGSILPPFDGHIVSTDRSIYAVEAKFSAKGKPLFPVSAMVLKNKYKLLYYRGYEELGNVDSLFELYDLENDPEELNDLYPTKPQVFESLHDELLAKIDEKDLPYQD